MFSGMFFCIAGLVALAATPVLYVGSRPCYSALMELMVLGCAISVFAGFPTLKGWMVILVKPGP